MCKYCRYCNFAIQSANFDGVIPKVHNCTDPQGISNLWLGIITYELKLMKLLLTYCVIVTKILIFIFNRKVLSRTKRGVFTNGRKKPNSAFAFKKK